LGIRGQLFYEGNQIVKNILLVSYQRIIAWFFFAVLCLGFIQPEHVHAQREVKSVPFNGYEMKILEISRKEIQVVFNFETAPKEITGFIVDNPTRIVIDIFGIPSRTARGANIEVSTITKLRVGIHQDKTRIVLDSPVKSGVNIHQEGTALSPTFVIVFEEDQPAQDQKENESSDTESKLKKQETAPAPTKEPTPSPTKEPTPVPTKIPTPKPTEVPTPVATEVPSTPMPIKEPTPELSDSKEEKDPKKLGSVEDTLASGDLDSTQEERLPPAPPKETQSITQLEESIKESEAKKKDIIDDGKAVVKTIVFQTTSDNFISSIVVTATSLGAYTLNQTVPGEYELTITRSKLKGDHLMLPQFPPDSFKGFKYVKSEERDDSVVVSIFVTEGVRLSPYIAQDKLWVRVE
jgi:hypothetical protein